MLVRLLANIGSRETDITPPLLEGQEREVDRRLGESLVARGLAVDITPPPSAIQAVPSKPAIAESQPPAIAVAEDDLKAYKARQHKTSTGQKKPAVLPVQPPDKKES